MSHSNGLGPPQQADFHQHVSPMIAGGQMLQQSAQAQQAWENAHTQAQPPNGLMLDAGAIMARLSNILDHIVRLNDRLNGYRLTDTGEKDKMMPKEPDTLRGLTDRSIEFLNAIDDELNIIEAKL
jgi:hypothetical protein